MERRPKLSHLENWSRQAGDILRQGFRNTFEVKLKGTHDLVTDLDYRSEKYLIETIRQHFPDHRILTEESGHLKGVDGCWYIDPLDGTINFAHGIPFFAISLAYADADDIQMAVVYDPIQDECFSAERGKGAWLNGKLIRVTQTKELINSLMSASLVFHNKDESSSCMAAFNLFAGKVQGLRRMGSAALELAYLAAGRLDGLWDMRLSPWDLAAGVLLTKEAGGVVTDLEGGSNYLKTPCMLAAANPSLHPKILELLKEVKLV